MFRLIVPIVYCTPAILGKRHCCKKGQKWDSKEKVCTGSKGCLSTAPKKLRLKNCVSAIRFTLSEKGKRNFNEGINYLAQECITSGQVCCGVDLGGSEKSYKCVPESKYIK